MNIIDKIYIINLDNRKDRWNKCIEQLKKYNITNYERFPAILYKGCAPIKKGAMGCKLSHLNVLKKARDENINNVLILEDDFLLCNNFLTKYNNIIDNIIQKKITFNMLFLGFSLYAHPKYVDTSISNLKKIKNGLAAHAYIVNNTFYNTIINAIENYNREVDLCYVQLQSIHNNIYTVFPCFVGQFKSFSDIENRYVDYKKYIPLDKN